MVRTNYHSGKVDLTYDQGLKMFIGHKDQKTLGPTRPANQRLPAAGFWYMIIP